MKDRTNKGWSKACGMGRYRDYECGCDCPGHTTTDETWRAVADPYSAGGPQNLARFACVREREPGEIVAVEQQPQSAATKW